MRVPPGAQLVFQQVLNATSGDPPSAFSDSDPRFNDWLGKANDLRLFAVVDRVMGPVVTLFVLVFETPDEEIAWFPSLGGVPNINVPDVSATDITVVSGSDTGSMRSGRPSTGFRKLQVSIQGDDICSARVRVWATGRGGYRRVHRLLFAERMTGTSSLYTMQQCDWLSSVDQLGVAVVADEVSGTSPTLTVQTEESSNGRTWTNVNATPELNGVTITPGFPAPSAFGFSDSLPLSGFIRFRLQLGGTSPVGTVKLWVTGREIRSS